MSQAAAQANGFYEQVAREKRAFAFLHAGALVSLDLPPGRVLPLWSTRSRVTRVRRAHPSFEGATVVDIPLDDLLGRILPGLQGDGLRVALNWDGSLVGFKCEPRELQRNVEYWVKNLATRSSRQTRMPPPPPTNHAESWVAPPPSIPGVDVEVVGVHPVPTAIEPCWLVELTVRGLQGTFRADEITQDAWGKDPPGWQAAYMEQVLDSAGVRAIQHALYAPIEVTGELRLAFYFHYLDVSRPLRTPVGSVRLPAPTPIPERLSFMRCVPVD